MGQTVLIKGAGIAGLLAGHILKTQRPDVDFQITDPAGFPARNASFVAGGMLAPYGEIEFLPGNFLNIGLEGIEFWSNFAKNYPGAQIHHNGSILVAHGEDRHMLSRIQSHLDEHRAPYTILDKAALSQKEPDLQDRFDHGLSIEAEGHLDPKTIMQILCGDLGEHYQKIPERTPDWTIDCTGMGAARCIPDLRGVKGETLIVRNLDFALSQPVRLMHPRYPLYIIPRGDSIFMIGATIIESADDTVSLRSSMELMSALYSLHRSFGEAEIIDLRAGVRPAFADNLPRILVDEENKTLYCNGLFRHGYLLGPILASAAVDYLSGTRHKYWDILTRDSNEDHDQRAA